MAHRDDPRWVAKPRGRHCDPSHIGNKLGIRKPLAIGTQVNPGFGAAAQRRRSGGAAAAYGIDIRESGRDNLREVGATDTPFSNFSLFLVHHLFRGSFANDRVCSPKALSSREALKRGNLPVLGDQKTCGQ